jgi:hypothetical protein
VIDDTIDAVVSRWEIRLREWPTKRAAVLAELERDGSAGAIKLKARLEALIQERNAGR